MSQKCDKITGLCQCRRGVEGRTCDKLDFVAHSIHLRFQNYDCALYF